jgi:uncharacterized protein (TIGR00251 family)
MDAPSTRLRLRVSPGARRSGVVGRHGETWKVRVSAPPENGRANDALVRLLAETLELPRRAVTLVSGHAGREKTVELAGIGSAQTERRLAAATRIPRRKDDGA